MNETVITYTLYLILAVSMTVWVARTLHKNGRIFLVDCFHGNTDLADSVNHLLLVGFYLMNIGFVSLYLKTAEEISRCSRGLRGAQRQDGRRAAGPRRHALLQPLRLHQDAPPRHAREPAAAGSSDASRQQGSRHPRHAVKTFVRKLKLSFVAMLCGWFACNIAWWLGAMPSMDATALQHLDLRQTAIFVIMVGVYTAIVIGMAWLVIFLPVDLCLQDGSKLRQTERWRLCADSSLHFRSWPRCMVMSRGSRSLIMASQKGCGALWTRLRCPMHSAPLPPAAWRLTFAHAWIKPHAPHQHEHPHHLLRRPLRPLLALPALDAQTACLCSPRFPALRLRARAQSAAPISPISAPIRKSSSWAMTARCGKAHRLG
jgi:hypothetical protein